MPEPESIPRHTCGIGAGLKRPVYPYFLDVTIATYAYKDGHGTAAQVPVNLHVDHPFWTFTGTVEPAPAAYVEVRPGSAQPARLRNLTAPRGAGADAPMRHPLHHQTTRGNGGLTVDGSG
jgi:hypothetical protein